MRYTSAKHRPTYTFDVSLQLKDAGAVTADGAAQVLGAAKILDLGGTSLSAGLTEADVVIDITAITVGADNRYDVLWQLSNSATFASGIVDGSALVVGNAAAVPGDVTSTVGRYILPVRSEINGTWYRYARLFIDVTGTTPSINFTAYLAKPNEL